MSFDAETVMAFVDGELDAVTSRRIEKAMQEDDALAAVVRRQRALRQRLSARFDPVLDEQVPGRLTALLANLDTSIAERRAARQWGAPQWVAIAASLAIGLFIGRAGTSGDTSPIAEAGGVLVAQGELGRALDTRLASAQSAGAKTRIGLTFRDRQGAICRSFEANAAAGIACRSQGHWQLRHVAPGYTGATEYRQAASAEVVEAAQAMMAGDAFDARAEQAARARGWR